MTQAHKFFLAAWCALCLGVAPLWAQFETRSSTLVSTTPNSIAVGDFNRDGIQDLAVLAFSSSQVAVLLGKGDGTFQKPAYYAAVASSIATADFRNNGILDLVLTDNLSDNLQVLLGNGDGTFGPSAFYPTPNSPNVIGTGDFNGDGKIDVVIVDQSGICPCISVLLGNGDGSFQAAITTVPPDAATAIGIGDFNRDGKLDLVTVGQFGSLSQIGLLLGNGDGTFTPGESYTPGPSPQSVAVADFNGDGKLDLAVANAQGGSIEVLFGNGDGTFQYGPVLATLSFPGAVQAADFNGDGKADLVIATGLNSTVVSVYQGIGDGTFRRTTNFPVAGEAATLAVGDFNGDSQIDIVDANYSGNAVIMMLNTGVVGLSPTTPLAFPAQLVGTTSTSQTVTLTNNGKTTLRIFSITHTGQFGTSTTCGASLGPHKQCTISATFSPQTRGAKSGLISITDSASSKPQVIELSGAGTVVELDPSFLTFGTQKIGTKSASQQVQLSNTGIDSLTITKVIVTGTNAADFLQTNTCPSSLVASANCIITVTFDPKKTGTRTAQISVTDSGGASPQIVPLTGTGD